MDAATADIGKGADADLDASANAEPRWEHNSLLDQISMPDTTDQANHPFALKK